MKRIHQCTICREFTLETTHCGMNTEQIIPTRYRPDFPYKEQRRQARKH